MKTTTYNYLVTIEIQSSVDGENGRIRTQMHDTINPVQAAKESGYPLEWITSIELIRRAERQQEEREGTYFGTYLGD